MIIGVITDLDRYSSISPALATAIHWLSQFKAESFTKGKTIIGEHNGAEIYVNSEEPALIPRDMANLEAHRKYIDIHVPLKGVETIGWAPIHELKHARGAYDEEKDLIFYGDSAHSMLHVQVGQAAIFFPEDAHAPNIGLGNHRKLCIKVPI